MGFRIPAYVALVLLAALACAPARADNRGAADEKLEIVKFQWGLRGKVLAHARITFRNTGAAAIVDPLLRCEFYGESGRVLTGRKIRVPLVFEPGKTRTTKDLTLGFVDQQAASGGCAVVEATWR